MLALLSLLVFLFQVTATQRILHLFFRRQRQMCIRDRASGSVSLSTAAGTAVLEGFTFLSEPVQRPGTALRADSATLPERATKPAAPVRLSGISERRVGGGSFLAYPNPTEGILYLQVRFDEATLGGYIRLSDSFGRELRRLGRVASGTCELDLRGIASGWYCVSLFDEAGRLLDLQRVVLR